MPLNDFVVNVTPDGSRRGIILARINERRIDDDTGEVQRTDEMSVSEIESSEIIESEKLIYADPARIEEDGISDQLGQFLDDLNSAVPFDINEGEGPFNSFQSMQLKQIPPDRILTHADANRNFSFNFEFQNITISGNISGSNMRTYQDLVNALNSLIATNGGGGTVSYVTLDITTGNHGLLFTSNTNSRPGMIDPTTTTTIASITSRVSVEILLDQDYLTNNNYDSTTTSTTDLDDNAQIFISMPQYDERSILTRLDPTMEYSFSLERLNTTVPDLEGNQRVRIVTVTGTNVTRLDLLIAEINSILADDAEISFSVNLPNYALLTIKSVEIGILGLSISSADLFHEMGIPFELNSPVSGGSNLYEVLRYTWRFDQREWTRVVPYEWLEFRLGVATEMRGQLTSSGTVSSGIILPEGEMESADTPAISAIDQELTFDSLSLGNNNGEPAGQTIDGSERTSLGIGLL